MQKGIEIGGEKNYDRIGNPLCISYDGNSISIGSMIIGGGPQTGVGVYQFAPTTISETTLATIDIYPNPSAKVFYCSGLIPGTAYSVWDITGRLCFSNSAESDAVEINMQAYKPGIFVLKTDANHTVKLIKQ